MIKHSCFFKMDYFYHDYPFKCDFGNEEQVKSESATIEKILLSSVKKKI